LKNKPVVIGVYSGRTEDSGAVSTANYVARQYGVKSGMPLFLARRKLEGTGAIFMPVDYEYYEEISEKIMKILRGYADIFEQVGIDEAFLDVSHKVQGNFENTESLVKTLKTEVKTQVGATFSVGVGPNKLVAKIASDTQKPNGLTIVKPEDVERFLNSLPVDRLIGVGRKIAQKMNALYLKTIGDLSKHDVQKLVAIFGKTLGVYFHNASKGLDNEPVKEAGDAVSISRIGTLRQNTRDLALISSKTDELIGEIHDEIMQKNLKFKQVSILAVMTDLTIRSRSLTLEQPTRDAEILKNVVQTLLAKFVVEEGSKVRRIGIKVSSLVKEEKKQRQLTNYFSSQ
jgi:DNA polymerase IV (DinB-like DNA polymerase)